MAAAVARRARPATGDIALTSDSGSDSVEQDADNYQLTGSGSPTTCFVPGLGQSTSDTRPFGSGVVGSKVFVSLPGHDQRPVAGDLSYEQLIREVSGVIRNTRATRAVGVSLGASVLLSLPSEQLLTLDRLVLALPASIDEPRAAEMIEFSQRIADAIDSNDQIALPKLLVQMQPPSTHGRADVRMWARRQAAELGGTSVAEAFRVFPSSEPPVSLAALEEVQTPALVVAQREDPWHSVETAEQLAATLPNARLVVSDVPWLWRARAELREVISQFLNT